MKVAYRCWDADPDQRGSFLEILQDLGVHEDAYPTIVHDPKEETGLIAVDQARKKDFCFVFC